MYGAEGAIKASGRKEVNMLRKPRCIPIASTRGGGKKRKKETKEIATGMKGVVRVNGVWVRGGGGNRVVYGSRTLGPPKASRENAKRKEKESFEAIST